MVWKLRGKDRRNWAILWQWLNPGKVPDKKSTNAIYSKVWNNFIVFAVE